MLIKCSAGKDERKDLPANKIECKIGE